jgi:CRISPR/Cas system endoribonuclease Cas6 (RAMP superfamily)
MFHTDCAWRLDHAGLRQIAKEAEILDQRLTWQDWARYSSRQQQKIPMGGVVGSYLLNTNGLEPLWPFLWLGQWTHLGKGAVMGLGRYKIEEAETSRLHKSQPRGEE